MANQLIPFSEVVAGVEALMREKLGPDWAEKLARAIAADDEEIEQNPLSPQEQAERKEQMDAIFNTWATAFTRGEDPHEAWAKFKRDSEALAASWEEQ